MIYGKAEWRPEFWDSVEDILSWSLAKSPKRITRLDVKPPYFPVDIWRKVFSAFLVQEGIDEKDIISPTYTEAEKVRRMKVRGLYKEQNIDPDCDDGEETNEISCDQPRRPILPSRQQTESSGDIQLNVSDVVMSPIEVTQPRRKQLPTRGNDIRVEEEQLLLEDVSDNEEINLVEKSQNEDLSKSKQSSDNEEIDLVEKSQNIELSTMLSRQTGPQKSKKPKQSLDERPQTSGSRKMQKVRPH